MESTWTCADGTIRPGGVELTERALRLAGAEPDMRIADIGCGTGTTLRHLKTLGFLHAVGLENNPQRHALCPENAILGDAAHMPFRDSSMDVLLFECSFSKMDFPEQVARECARVLVPGGALVLTDLYARGKAARLNGILGRVDQKETLLSYFTTSGFTIEVWEDHTQKLNNLFAQMLFDGVPLCDLGADRAELRAIRCGYAIIAARKETPCSHPLSDTPQNARD